MASNARDVEIDILANDKTARGTRSAANNFDKLNDHVIKTTRKIGANAGKAGSDAGMVFGKNLTRTLSRTAAAAAPVLAGMAIAAAPVIGATISAAVIGGAGIGGVVGGALIASRDARVQAAFASLGDSITTQLEDSATSFVHPLIAATHEVRASFQRAGNDIQGILRKSATFVKPLTQGATYAFERVISGVNKLVQGARPVINALRDGMANVGEAVEDVFDSLSDNGVDAAVALNVAFGAIEGTIRTVGAAVNGLTEAFGFLAKWGAFGKDVALQYRAAETAAKHNKEANDQAAGSFQRVGGAAAAAATEVKSFAETLEEGRQNNLGLMEAQTRASIAIRDTTAAIKDNNKNIKDSKERADQNMLALLGLAEQFNRVREETAKANGVGVESVQITKAQRDAFIAAARAAGLDAKEAQNLANQLFGIPENVNSKVKVDKAQAAKDAAEMRQHLRDIPTSINVRVKVSATGISAARRAIHEAGGATGFDAMSHFRAVDTTSGRRSTTGGPAEVSVTNNLRVDLDGRPFRDYTDRSIANDRERTRYRELVGRR